MNDQSSGALHEGSLEGKEVGILEYSGVLEFSELSMEDLIK
jgi:hypothetical protein